MACRSAPADIPVRAALGTVRAFPRPVGMPPDDLCNRSVMAMRHAPGHLAARGFASLAPSCFGGARSSGRSGEFEFTVHVSTLAPSQPLGLPHADGPDSVLVDPRVKGSDVWQVAVALVVVQA